jgi:hypothetical protein
MQTYNEWNNEVVGKMKPGDLVDFGKYGALYVVSIFEQTIWVTDNKADRFNSEAEGHYVRKIFVEKILEAADTLSMHKLTTECEKCSATVEIRVYSIELKNQYFNYTCRECNHKGSFEYDTNAERRFIIKSECEEPFSLAEFYEKNEFSDEEKAAIEALEVNGKLTIGGGSAGFFELVRVA